MGISIWQLMIVLVIVLLLFGTKKLRNLGSDLGSAVKGFRSAVKEGGAEPKAEVEDPSLLEQEEASGTVMEGEVSNEERDRV